MLENYENNCCLITDIPCFVLFIQNQGAFNCYLDHVITLVMQEVVSLFVIVVILFQIWMLII